MTLSKHELFVWQAPSFNFELDANQILTKALKVGFVREVGEDQYEINENYGEEYAGYGGAN